jgi:hypothetical protein
MVPKDQRRWGSPHPVDRQGLAVAMVLVPALDAQVAAAPEMAMVVAQAATAAVAMVEIGVEGTVAALAAPMAVPTAALVAVPTVVAILEEAETVAEAKAEVAALGEETVRVAAGLVAGEATATATD